MKCFNIFAKIVRLWFVRINEEYVDEIQLLRAIFICTYVTKVVLRVMH